MWISFIIAVYVCMAIMIVYRFVSSDYFQGYLDEEAPPVVKQFSEGQVRVIFFLVGVHLLVVTPWHAKEVWQDSGEEYSE